MNRPINRVTFSAVIFIFLFNFNAQALHINGKVISDTSGIKVIRVWGTHYQRGFAQGYLLAENIQDIYTGYMVPFMGKYLEAIKNHLRVEEVVKIDPVFHDEAKGMLEGMKKAGVVIPNFDEYNILLANAFLDMMGMSSFKELRELRKELGCSSLISWSNSKKKSRSIDTPVITRHLDWPANDFVINNQVVVIHIPSEPNEQNWLMVGFAGQISVLSGVNSKGISAFLHMLNDFNEEDIPLPLKPYEPLPFTLRKALEHKDFNNDGICSIDDIKSALNANTQGYAEGFIVSMLGKMQKDSSKVAAIAELAPTLPYITYRDETYNDNIKGKNIYTANSSIKRLNKKHYCQRYIETAKAVNSINSVSSAQAWEIMKNHSALSNNIQFMQYKPEDKTLKISVYNDGLAAFEQKPYTLNLKLLLR